MVRSRAKTISTESQICVKIGGNMICVRRPRDVNTGHLKILQKILNKANFHDIL